MAIHTILYRALLVLAVVALVAGCSDPKSNPYVAPPPLREGTPLDLTSTHITTAGSPYIVNSDWNIEAGRTVDIDPGVEIMFAGVYNVVVDGVVRSNGAADNPVKFTSAYLNRDLGQWGNIRLRNSTDASLFSYTVFEYGAHFNDDTSSETSKFYRGTLSIRNSSPTIENCLAYKNQDNAIYIHADEGATRPAPTVRYCIFTKNDGAALRTSELVDLSQITFHDNAVGDNSIIPYLLQQVDSSYGYLCCLNANLDSVDQHSNLLDDNPPEMTDPDNGDYSLTSCSPAVDAGSADTDIDGTRRDLGVAPYHQVANELRGVWSGTLNGNQTYRMSCDVRVPVGETLTIPAGVRIEATGLYTLQVYGRLEIHGASDNRVVICNCQVPGSDIWGGVWFYNLDTTVAGSVVQNTDIVNYQHVVVWARGTQFEGVHFIGGQDYGVFVNTYYTDQASEAVSFRQCVVNDCGLWGIVGYEAPVIVHSSLVQNIKGRGIWMKNTGLTGEIKNTIVRACSTSAVVLENASSPAIVNCVLTDNGYHGLHLINNCNPVVMNSIIWRNHHLGIYAAESSLPQMSYNNIAGNIERDLDPGWMPCTECIAADPLFTGNCGVELAAGSPSIDTGNPDPQYNDAGNASRNDQGAFGGPLDGPICPSNLYRSNQTVVQR